MIAHAVSPNSAAPADTELVVRALAGREDGFEELVRRYQRPIVAYVYRMVGDYDAARIEEMEVEGQEGTTFEKPLASKAPTPEQETERGERRAEIEEVVAQLQ